MRKPANFATVHSRSVVTHVLVPLKDFERLTRAAAKPPTPPSNSDINAAAAIFKNPKTVWHDANDVFQSLVLSGIERVRREHKLSQGELGRRVGLSQPQISRLERNPANATLATLQRIAAALNTSRPTARETRKHAKKRPA